MQPASASPHPLRIRTNLQPGDVGRIITLHGVLYAQEYGFDPTFEAFHRWCDQRGLPLSILSAGLGEVIAAFMDNAGLVLPITANSAHHFENGFGLVPMDRACPTGVDKAMVLRASKAQGIYTVFVGDGFSDRLAAPEADLVYAKTDMALARYCTARRCASNSTPTPNDPGGSPAPVWRSAP